jgi:hypothetical protein
VHQLTIEQRLLLSVKRLVSIGSRGSSPGSGTTGLDVRVNHPNISHALDVPHWLLYYLLGAAVRSSGSRITMQDWPG